MYLLSLKGMHDEGNYSHRLRGILRVDDARTFPTFNNHATSCTDWLFISTFSPESNFSSSVSDNGIFGGIIKIPSVVGPFSFKRDSMSWEEKREIPVMTHAAQNITPWEPSQCCAQVQYKGWHGQGRPQTGFVPLIFCCTHHTLMLTLKDWATFLFIRFYKIVKRLNPTFPIDSSWWIALSYLPIVKQMIWDKITTPHGDWTESVGYLRSRILSLGEAEKTYVRLTRIAKGRLPSGQTELSSFPNRSPPSLTFGMAHTWSSSGTEPRQKHDFIQEFCSLSGLSFASKEEIRSLHGIV